MMLYSFVALKKFCLISVVGVWGVQIPAFVLFRFLFACAVCLRGRSNCLLGLRGDRGHRAFPVTWRVGVFSVFRVFDGILRLHRISTLWPCAGSSRLISCQTSTGTRLGRREYGHGSYIRVQFRFH